MTESGQSWMPACQRRGVMGVKTFSSFIFWPKKVTTVAHSRAQSRMIWLICNGQATDLTLKPCNIALISGNVVFHFGDPV